APESQREVLGLIRRRCSRRDRPISAVWITHRLEELELCDGAALMEAGRLGRWQSPAALLAQLPPLLAGPAER
ncbi:MAG: ABC transporter ATP-binding protein, partial [Cyanobium sp.]